MGITDVFDLHRADFICDRPFIVVVEGTNGVPLFMGIIENPSDSAGL